MATDFIIGNTDGRVQLLNSAPFRASAKYVLYWAQVNRRVAWNHGLAYAVELANQAGLPVLFYEGLTFDYPYASDRFDKFILEGVSDTRTATGAARDRLRFLSSPKAQRSERRSVSAGERRGCARHGRVSRCGRRASSIRAWHRSSIFPTTRWIPAASFRCPVSRSANMPLTPFARRFAKCFRNT